MAVERIFASVSSAIRKNEGKEGGRGTVKCGANEVKNVLNRKNQGQYKPSAP